MKRLGLLALALAVVAATPSGSAAGARGNAFVGGYANSTIFAPDGLVVVRGVERRIDLATGAVGPHTCIAFVEYACGAMELTVLPTLHHMRLVGTLTTGAGGRIEVDLEASSGAGVNGVGLGNARPAASVCTAVYPACNSAFVGGGTNVWTSGVPVGTFRYFDASNNLTREFRPVLCECWVSVSWGWGSGVAVFVDE